MPYTPGGFGNLYVKDASGDNQEILILSRAGYTPNPAATETRNSLNRGPRTNVSLPGPGVFDFDVEPNPLSDAETIMGERHISGADVTLEHFLGVAQQQDAGGSSQTVAITAVTGIATTVGFTVATAAGVPTSPWDEGLGLLMGTDDMFVIEGFAGPNTFRVKRWGEWDSGSKRATRNVQPIPAIAATGGWTLFDFQLFATYSGRVVLAGGYEASGAGALASSVQLQCNDHPVVVALTP